MSSTRETLPWLGCGDEVENHWLFSPRPKLAGVWDRFANPVVNGNTKFKKKVMKPIHHPHPLAGATLSPARGYRPRTSAGPGAEPAPDLRGEGLWGGCAAPSGGCKPKLVMAAFKSYPGTSSFLHFFLPSPLLRPGWSHLSRQPPIAVPRSLSQLLDSHRRILSPLLRHQPTPKSSPET